MLSYRCQVIWRLLLLLCCLTRLLLRRVVLKYVGGNYDCTGVRAYYVYCYYDINSWNYRLSLGLLTSLFFSWHTLSDCSRINFRSTIALVWFLILINLYKLEGTQSSNPRRIAVNPNPNVDLCPFKPKPTSFPIPSLNTLGSSFVDIVGVGNYKTSTDKK